MSRQNQRGEYGTFQDVCQHATISLYGDRVRKNPNNPQLEGGITIPTSLQVPLAQRMSERAQIYLNKGICLILKQNPEVFPMQGKSYLVEVVVVNNIARMVHARGGADPAWRGRLLHTARERQLAVSGEAFLAGAFEQARLSSSNRLLEANLRSTEIASGLPHRLANPPIQANGLPFPSRITRTSPPRQSPPRAVRNTWRQLRGDGPRPVLTSSPPRDQILTGANRIPVQPRSGDTQRRLEILRAHGQGEQMTRWGFNGYETDDCRFAAWRRSVMRTSSSGV